MTVGEVREWRTHLGMQHMTGDDGSSFEISGCLVEVLPEFSRRAEAVVLIRARSLDRGIKWGKVLRSLARGLYAAGSGR